MMEFSYDKPTLEDFGEIKAAILEAPSDEAQSKKAVLACEEIFANIVSYSDADEVKVSLEEAPGTLTVCFTDNGISFDPAEYDRCKDFSELDSGGMGIAMAKRIAKEMRYERQEERNVLILTFRR